MGKDYVLDTSAIFAYTKLEDGSDLIEHILSSAKKTRCIIYLSFISLTELYYVTFQEKNEDIAKELIILVKSLPVQILYPNERITLFAGRIKANHRLSVADAFVAAAAMDKNAILVHKDPELEAVSDYVKTIQLPLKDKFEAK